MDGIAPAPHCAPSTANPPSAPSNSQHLAFRPPHPWRRSRRLTVRQLARRARCYERRATVVDAFFDLVDTIITVRSLIPAGMDNSPLGRTPEPSTMTAPIRATS